MLWALNEDAFEKEWTDEWASTREKDHYYFRVRLQKGRLDEILGSPQELLHLRHSYDELKQWCKTLKECLAHYKVDLEAEVIRRTNPRTPPLPKQSPVGGTWDDEDDQKQNAAGDDGGQSSSTSSSTGEYDGRAALRNKRMIHFGF
jgi:hypothetical protein